MLRIKLLLDRTLEFIVITTAGILVVDVLWQVFARFFLKDPSSWTEELATFLLIWVTLLGSAVALGRGAHLGIDYFVLRQDVPHRHITFTIPKRLRVSYQKHAIILFQ